MPETQSIETTETNSEAARPIWHFRPDAVFPKWSVVTSGHAENALLDIIRAFGIEKCFDGFSETEDRVRRTLFNFYADEGHAPSTEVLARLTGLTPTDAKDTLRSLKKRDLVTLDADTETITGAYPFTSRETEHRVQIGDRSIHAMCAIDALGTGGMFGRDIVIESSCRATGVPVRIETGKNGTAIKSADPASTVVWSGIRLSDGCAADTLCTVLAFFASPQVFEEWRAKEQPNYPGYLLTLEEGMQVGRGIFEPFLN